MFVLPRSWKTRQVVSLLRRCQAGGFSESRSVSAGNPDIQSNQANIWTLDRRSLIQDEVTKRDQAGGGPITHRLFSDHIQIWMGLPSGLMYWIRLPSAYPSYGFRDYACKLLSYGTVRPVKRDEKLDPVGDHSGLDGIESHLLLIHDPMTRHFVRLCVASKNRGVQACFLYNVGYRLLLSGNRPLSLQILKILKNLDENLSELLSSKLNKNLPKIIVDEYCK